MRYLRIGVTGDDVLKWEHFLHGTIDSSLVVDGKFTKETAEATKKFQIKAGFTGSDVDGVVGSLTYGRAAAFGFNIASDDSDDEYGPNWPKKPDVERLSLEQRKKLFGEFKFVAAPTSTNPERIQITDGWADRNIKQVHVPQLKNVAYAPASCMVDFNVKCAKQLQSLFAAWEAAGLLHLVLTWGGSYVSRFIRGSRSVLSNHSWGNAFDINVVWNQLGTTPALKGKQGSVRELVDIAYAHGFAWGGHFSQTRADGMHFEIYRIIS